MMKKSVLLGFIKPVDFIYKKNCLSLINRSLIFRLFNNRPDIPDTGKNS